MILDKTFAYWRKENALSKAECCGSCVYMSEEFYSDYMTHDCSLATREITSDEYCKVAVFQVCKMWSEKEISKATNE